MIVRLIDSRGELPGTALPAAALRRSRFYTRQPEASPIRWTYIRSAAECSMAV
jgi:hypothetical protein